jgi:hypothetical protein
MLINKDLPSCIVCLDTDQKNMLQIKPCCGIQFVHMECMNLYFEKNKQCFICHKNITDKITTKTITECSLSRTFFYFYVVCHIVSFGLALKTLVNTYEETRYWKLALSGFIISAATLLFCFCTLVRNIHNVSFETCIGYDSTGYYCDEAYGCMKNDGCCYTCEIDMNILPLPWKLGNTRKSAVIKIKCMVLFFGIINSCLNAGVYVLNLMSHDKNFINIIYGSISFGSFAPYIIFLIVYPIVFRFFSCFFYICYSACCNRRHVTDMKQEFLIK